MKKEFEDKLYKKAPLLFSYISDNTIPISYGIECGDGWYHLLDCLIDKLSELDKNKELRVFQIKQKFGGFRFYVNFLEDNILNEKVQELILEAEEKARFTCELCGKPGKIRTEGWLITLCNKCSEDK